MELAGSMIVVLVDARNDIEIVEDVMVAVGILESAFAVGLDQVFDALV